MFFQGRIISLFKLNKIKILQKVKKYQLIIIILIYAKMIINGMVKRFHHLKKAIIKIKMI
jgi:hypothetical protein